MSTQLPQGGGRGYGRGMGMVGMGSSFGGTQSPGDASSAGLKPERNIAGFSIRREDGSEIPLIFEAAVGKARDTVILKLSGRVPAHASLWYGHGLNPYCNLTDGFDMAVPVFGPIDLDPTNPVRTAAAATPAAAPSNAGTQAGDPAVKVLIITGDTVSAHDWKRNIWPN